MEMGSLTLDEFMKYKSLNQDVHPDIIPYMQTIRPKKFKSSKRVQWKSKRPNNDNEWSAISQFSWTSDEKMMGEITVILNKMTIKKYDWVRQSIENLKINNEQQFKSLIDKVFEYGYRSILSELYAELCKDLSPIFITIGKTKYHYRRIFIKKCQQMFQSAIAIKSDDDIECSDFIYKDNVVKCIVFLGELYNYSVLTNKIIHSCFHKLIAIASPKKTYIINCICDLMKTVGKKLYNKSYKETEKLFQKIKELQNDKSYKTKERFQFMDLFDLIKKEGWYNK